MERVRLKEVVRWMQIKIQGKENQDCLLILMIHCGIQRQVFIPASIPTVFKQLREKGILTGIASGRGIFGVVPEIRELKPDFFCNPEWCLY